MCKQLVTLVKNNIYHTTNIGSGKGVRGLKPPLSQQRGAKRPLISSNVLQCFSYAYVALYSYTLSLLSWLHKLPLAIK